MFGSVRSVERVARSCKRHRNLQKIRRNLQKPSRSAPKIAEISLDLLKSRRISPNLVWISLHIARFVYNVGQVGWLGFWRRKPATRPAGVGSWAQKPVTDHRSGRFGRLPVRVRAGCSGWSGSGLGWTPLTIGKIYDLNSSCHFNYFPFFFFHSIFHSLEIFSHLTKMFTKNWLHTPQRKRAMILVPHGDIGQTNEEYDNASRQ